MRPKIEIRYPDGRAETITLTRERTVIGRSPSADIRVDDNRVSREHCVIELDSNRLYVTDLGGSNGTWVGSAKLLANVREPFPQEAVLHVGPAQLRNVTARPDPANDLESQIFSPVAPSRDSGRAAPSSPSRPDRSQQAPSAVTLELEKRSISLNAGERGSLLLHVGNQSKIVDHYTLSVSGVPTTWVTLPRAGIELLPRENGTLAVDLHPPRSTRTSAGRHNLSVALLNKQKQVVAETTAELEIAAFDNLSLDVRPNPYESRSGGELTLTVENQGNTLTDYRVSVIEPSDALIITVDPPISQVAPQQSRQSVISIKPRKRLWIGQAKRMPLTVSVSSNLQTVSATPTYTQLAMVPMWLPIIFLMLCCVLLPLFSLMLLGPIQQEIGARSTAEAATLVAPQTFAAATLTAQPTNTPLPDIDATITADWRAQDCSGDGMTNGEKFDRDLKICETDSDGDGLSDYEEIFVYGTDPLLPDTSGDGLSDGETIRWRDEGEPREWYGCLDPRHTDGNRDGIPNYVHILNGTNPCAGAPTATPEPTATLEPTATPEPAAPPPPTNTPAPTPITDFGLGGQVSASPANLPIVQQSGMSWVKVQVDYSSGMDHEATVANLQAYQNFKLLVALVGNVDDVRNGGFAYFQQFANFAAELTVVADAIEIWREPNVAEGWPEGQINPQVYAQLLQLSHSAIKSRNQAVMVISGGLAATTIHNGVTIWADDRFVQGLMAAGARDHMDCVGVHFKTGATPPNETTGHPADDGENQHTWYFVTRMNLYWSTFNPPDVSRQIPLCFTEIGFLSDEGFTPNLAELGANNFLWALNSSAFDQSVWLDDALQRSCYSGKVKLFVVWNVDFTAYEATAPDGGYAMIRPDGSCPSCTRLNNAMNILRANNCA